MQLDTPGLGSATATQPVGKVLALAALAMVTIVLAVTVALGFPTDGDDGGDCDDLPTVELTL